MMRILKVNAINWRERKLNSNMYADKSVKITDQKEPRIVNTGIGDRKASCLLPILFTLYSQYLTK